MPDFDFLKDDRLVDALVAEVADMLQALIAEQRPGRIDLLGLPLSVTCLAALEQRLGHGEVAATLKVSGETLVRETRFAGVWWTSHYDEAGRLAAMLIEVTAVPEILLSSRADMEQAHAVLVAGTRFSLARKRA